MTTIKILTFLKNLRISNVFVVFMANKIGKGLEGKE
jgi:hypothetical protein